MEHREEPKKPGAMGLPHYSLDGHLKLRDNLERLHKDNSKNLELVRSNGEKIRNCVKSLKKEYGY